MKKALYLALLAVLILSGSVDASAKSTFSCDNVSEIPKIECEALVELYNSTDGPNWVCNTNWLVTNTPSNWCHVWLQGSHVLYLFLDANSLSGSIPPELSNLTYLNQLTMTFNQLTGNIPPGIFNLPGLTYLRVGNNQLTGQIPPEIGNLTYLENLDLSNNQFTGNIPVELGSLAYLHFLYLDHNELMGNIFEPSNLTHLVELYLQDNHLAGVIPAGFGSLTDLLTLDLGYNFFDGSIPPELGNLTNLRILRLNNNDLEGTVPGTLVNLTQLVDPGMAYDGGDGLSLDDNHLTVPPGYPVPGNPLDDFLVEKDPDWHLSQTIEQKFFLPFVYR